MVACGLELSGVAPADGAVPDADAPLADGSVGDDGEVDAELDASEDVDGSFLRDAPFDGVIEIFDASLDGSCPLGSFRCGANNTCVGSCLGCAGARLGCPIQNTCVGACAACAVKFECWRCKAGSPGNLASATCEVSPTMCTANVYCDCKNFPGCPGSEQVCFKPGQGIPWQCRGCGEQSTGQADCVSGGTCNAVTFQCQ
jgi:hypothetical protein